MEAVTVGFTQDARPARAATRCRARSERAFVVCLGFEFFADDLRDESSEGVVAQATECFFHNCRVELPGLRGAGPGRHQEANVLHELKDVFPNAFAFTFKK